MNRGVMITVGVPTCNRASVLVRALRCLVAQETDGQFHYDIVVVDNGSSDNTSEIVAQLEPGSAVAVRHVIEPRRGIPFVRNMAIEECRGDWLAFFDDDQLTSTTWLKTLYQAAIERKSRFVGGSRELLIEDSAPVVLSSECRMLLGEVVKPKPQYYHSKFLPSTGNVLIQKSVFDDVGGFDTSVLDGGEDSDFFNRVVSNGIPGFYNPSALVQHLIPPNRIDPAYLRWVAFRHGIHLARRDIRQRGKLRATYHSSLRVARAVGVYWPQKIRAQWARDPAEVLGIECRLSKVEGFLSFVRNQIFPSPGSQQRLHDRSMHRGQR